MTTASPTITGVDFVSIPTQDLDRAIEFYETKLGLRRSAYRPERHHAEFETGNLTLTVMHAEKMGLGHHLNRNHVALHVEDIQTARNDLESRGVAFEGETFDTGVCHMAFFADPDGNALMLHHRYAPRGGESDA